MITIGNKLYDSTAAVQLIGCILNSPSLLDDDSGKYFFNERDFVNDLHKVTFGAAYNLRQMGADNVNIKTIEDYLQNRPESLATYKANNGGNWLVNAMANADISNFEYYYDRIKKMTLLRTYNDLGVDISWFYDADNIFDIKKKERQENNLNKYTLNEIADMIDTKILSVRETCVDNVTDDSVLIGDSVFDILEELEQSPEIGVPLYGNYINTITRGARLGKVYMRSAATGVGKSRTLIADICNFACDKIYDTEKNEWVDNGEKLPALFISTELDIQEVTTMALAFLAGVNEEHILNNSYNFGEYERVQYAAEVLSHSPLYIEEMPDFSMKDIENCIKRNIRVHRIHYIGLDYIHTSAKLLAEISRISNGTKLREDNVLFLMGVKLKDIANQFGVFIITSTQLNGSWKVDDIPDQNLLRGQRWALIHLILHYQ